ncbi:MAG: malectin domain-containing carbohydrate-binding protein [Bryobacteraceae bacterium]
MQSLRLARTIIGLLLTAGAASAQTGVPLRLNCGGWSSLYTDTGGKSWAVDQYWTQGYIDYVAVYAPAWSPVYSSARVSLPGGAGLSYHIPVSNGSYVVTLHFAELRKTAPGQRVFDVRLNGDLVLPAFDILSQAPRLQPLAKSFPVTVSAGFVDIDFRNIVDLASIAAIEIEPPAGPVLSVAPASLTFSGVAGGAAIAPQTLQVANGIGTLGWTATSSATWLTASPGSGSGAATIQVSASAALAPGVHTANLTVTAAGAGGSPQTIPVTLNLQAPPVLSAAPATLTFTATQAGSAPATQPISITNTGGGTLNWTATANAPWISLSSTSGTAPHTLNAGVNAAGLALGSYTGTVTVTAAGVTGSPVAVGISLEVVPAPPVLSVVTTPITFTVPEGSTTPVSQTVSVANTGGGTLNWTATGNQAWLAVAPGSGSGTGSITVTANPTGLAAGGYAGVVTVTAAGAQGSPKSIPVQLTVQGGPALLVSPSSLTFTMVTGGANPASKAIDVSNTGGGSFTWDAASNQSWLIVGAGPRTLPGSVAVSVNGAGLAAGSYSGVVTVTAAGAQGSPRTVAVTLTVTTQSQSALRLNCGGWSSLYTDTGGKSWAVDQYWTQGYIDYVAVYAPAWSPVYSSARVSLPGGAGLSYHIPVSNGSYVVTLHFAELRKTAPGQRVTMSRQWGFGAARVRYPVASAAAAAARQELPGHCQRGLRRHRFPEYVDLASIAAIEIEAAPPAVLGVSPAALTFAATAGGANPAGQSIAVANTGGGSLTWSATSSQPWLTLSATSGTAPSAITAGINLTGLAAGVLTAQITVTPSVGPPQLVAVTLNLAAPPPILNVAPSTLTFTGVTGGANPAGQSIAIANTGGGTLSWTAASNQPWLTLSTASGTAPSTVTASVSLTGLSTGSLTGQITVTPSVGPPQVIAVTLTLTDPPQLSASPSVLTFTGATGGANPAGQSIAITNTGGGTLTWTAASNQPWLTLSTASGTAPSTVTASVNLTGLTAGTLNGQVTVTPSAGSPQAIAVTLTLTDPPPALNIAPSTLTFTGVTGGANPAGQSIAITNTGGGTLTWTAASNQPWLTLSTASGTAPSTVTRERQSDRTHSGNAQWTGRGDAISGFAASHRRHADPHRSSARVKHRAVYPDLHRVAGGANPAGQSIAITNTGGGTLTWTAASNQPWLTLSTASGTAPSTVTASVNLTGLTAGTLNGQVTVTPSVGPPQVVAVTLTLTDPPQLSASPSVLTFTGVTGGANPAGQSIAIANTGGGTLTWTAASNQPWLTLSTASGTAPSTVTASVNLTGLTAGTLNGQVTVTPSVGPPQVVAVTLTLTDPPQLSASPSVLISASVTGGAKIRLGEHCHRQHRGRDAHLDGCVQSAVADSVTASGTAPSTVAATSI